jgi:prophage regulatory protein
MSNSIKIGVLRLPAVIQLVGLSRSSIYLLIQQNAFPKPVQLSTRAVGWRHSDVETWLDSRAIAGKKEGV